ncbi:MAG TPA: tetratricopeptide repeat protein [Gemmatimonadaceae bacterium]|nr:tetratricopeptide repeat protein [Gemmatimonadaceae bacterium]
MSDALTARWQQYTETARRAYSQGMLEEAEEAYRAAVREGEQLGANTPQLAASLNALGQLRLQVDDLAGAEPLITRALGIAESSLGASHPEVAVALNNLARLCFKRRDFAKADRHLIRLLEIKRALGRDHPEVANVLGSLGRLRQAVGKNDQAEQLWRQALAVRERAFAPGDVIIATTLEAIADCCVPQGRVRDAIALRERALAIREGAVGTTHPSLDPLRAKLEELQAKTGESPLGTALDPPIIRAMSDEPKPIVQEEIPPPRASGGTLAKDLPWIETNTASEMDFIGAASSFGPPPTRPPAAPDIPFIANPPAPPASEPPVFAPPVALPPAPIRPPAPSPPPARPANDLAIMDTIFPESGSAAPPPLSSGTAPPPRRSIPRAPRPALAESHYVRRSGSEPRRSSYEMEPDLPAQGGGFGKVLFLALVVVGLAAGAWYMMRTAPVPDPEPVARPSTTLPSPKPGTIVIPMDSIRRRTAEVERAAAESTARAEAQRTRLVPVGDDTLDSVIRPALGEPHGGAAIDSVTRHIDQATKPRVDSASRIDPRPPNFGRP